MSLDQIRKLPAKQYKALKRAVEYQQLLERRLTIMDNARAFNGAADLLKQLEADITKIISSLEKDSSTPETSGIISWESGPDTKSKISHFKSKYMR
jgi:hypothetical protein